METSLARRRFLQLTAASAATVLVSNKVVVASTAEIFETRIISQDPTSYHGWPTLARCRDGRLIVVVSGGRAEHVCPFGRVEMMVSRDEGKTWGKSRVILDSDMDDRDGGVMETASGALIVTTFTSLAYEPILAKAEALPADSPKAWSPEKLRDWQSARDRLDATQRKAQLGEWQTRSVDGGLTWSARTPTLVNSPHGPLQLRDGRLIYAGKELWTEQQRIGVAESKDDGLTWNWLAQIPTRPGDDAKRHYHELHAVETADGRIIVHIRNHSKNHEGETLQTESADGGNTWTIPVAIGVWGLPSHLLKLKDDRLLMTYGYRRAPFGNQARISKDHGRTWSEAITISDDAANGDLGYPSTVELTDGSFLTVWYEQLKGNPQAVLRQAHWRI